MENTRLLEETDRLAAALRRLLSCPDLSLDELDPETHAACDQASDALSKYSDVAQFYRETERT